MAIEFSDVLDSTDVDLNTANATQRGTIDIDGVDQLTKAGDGSNVLQDDGNYGTRAYTHTHTEAQITDLDKYTQTEVDQKDAAIQAEVDTNTTKLSGIEDNATRDQNKVDIDALGIDAATVTSFTVGVDVPPDAVFTEYDDSDVLKDEDANQAVTPTNLLATMDDIISAGGGDMLSSQYDTGTWDTVHSVDNARLVNGLTVQTAVPIDASFTAYDDTAVQNHMADETNPHNTTYDNIGGEQPAPVAHDHVISDVTDLLPFSGIGTTGLVPDPLTVENRFLADDGSWIEAPVSPVGGVALDMKWSNNTTEVDPGSGNIKVNNNDQTLATEMYASEITTNANDAEFMWNSLHVNDYVGLWETGGETIYYKVISEPVDNDVWFTIGIEYIAGVGGIDNNQTVSTFFILDPSNKLPEGGTAGQVLTKVDATNYNTEWTTDTGIDADDYATDLVGGTIKILVSGTDCYITTDGSTPGP